MLNKKFKIFIFKIKNRSGVSNDFSSELMAPGYARRRTAGHVFVCAAIILAMHLPRPTTKRTKIFIILLAQTNCRYANLAVCRRPGHMGKMQ